MLQVQMVNTTAMTMSWYNYKGGICHARAATIMHVTCNVHIKINSKMSEKMNSREDVVNFAPGPAAIPTEVSIIKARF